jgi:hypothetical protein
MPDRPQKVVTFAEMRDRACVGCSSIAPTTAAATPSRSAGMAGRMTLGCRISRTVSPARPAASATLTSGRILTGGGRKRAEVNMKGKNVTHFRVLGGQPAAGSADALIEG